MASAMQNMQTSVQSRSVVPFRAAGKAVPRRQRMVVTKATQEPVADVARKMVAAFAAAAVTLTPFAANATGPELMPSRNRGEDNAARAFMDSQEKKGPAVQSRSSDPNSGNVDTDTVAGVQQADKRVPAGRLPKISSNQEIPLGEAQADLNAQPTMKGPNASKAAEEKLDPGAALKTAMNRAGPTNPAAWDLSSMQVNVATPDLNALMNKAASAKDKAAGAVKDAAGGDIGGKVQGVVGDAKSVAGSAKQGAKDLKNKRNVDFNGNPAGLQINVGVPSLGGLADKAKAGADKAAGAVKDAAGGDIGGKLQGASGDAKSALGDAKQGVKDLKNQPNVAFRGNAADLQVNVGLPSLDGLADKAKAGADKAAGAVRDAAGGDVGGKLQGASGDAKSALGDAKQGVTDLKNQPNVAFSGNASSLQVNVGQTTFGRGETGTTADQANQAGETVKDVVSDPARNAGNALDRAGQTAERVLSNPTGGPEQSKRAAEQVAESGSEIPKALQGGIQKAKNAITSPASFDIFTGAALQHSASLEV